VRGNRLPVAEQRQKAGVIEGDPRVEAMRDAGDFMNAISRHESGSGNKSVQEIAPAPA